MKGWREERCATQPDELQLIAQDTYVQRRNIHQVEHGETEDAPAYTEYVCESREIAVSEYELLKSIEGISTQEAIDNYTLQLIEEGVM